MAIKGNKGLTRNVFLPTLGRAVNQEFGRTSVPQGNQQAQQSQQAQQQVQIDPTAELLARIYDRINNFYVPKDGDVLFDCIGAVTNLAANVIPNVVGTLRTGFRYVVPPGQKLIIQNYLFFATHDLRPGDTHLGAEVGLDPLIWWSGFDNLLRIDGKSALYSNYQAYDGAAGGIVLNQDNLPTVTAWPNTDSQPNGLVNIIASGGSTFEWVLRRAQLVPAPPRFEATYFWARFRGFVTSKDSGKKNR